MPWASVQICECCWVREQGDRVPHRLIKDVPEEPCNDCGQLTQSGIYVRRQVERGDA